VLFHFYETIGGVVQWAARFPSAATAHIGISIGHVAQ
jgi:hypothetical protein